MTATITKLRFRRQGTEVEVHLDDERAFTLDTLSAAQLQAGQAITSDQCNTLRHQADQRRAWRDALAHLGRRARSRREMLTFLGRKGFDDAICQTTLERLTAANYLDDQAYAQRWLDQRVRNSPRGARALRFELRQKGIHQDVIDTLLADFEEGEAALTAARQRLRVWGPVDGAKLPLKLRRFLANRGFNAETIRETCRVVLSNQN